jgi:hypothetical protein
MLNAESHLEIRCVDKPLNAHIFPQIIRKKCFSIDTKISAVDLANLLAFCLWSFRFGLHESWQSTAFILNLALADFLYCILGLPFQSALYFMRGWPFGQVNISFIEERTRGKSV